MNYKLHHHARVEIGDIAAYGRAKTPDQNVVETRTMLTEAAHRRMLRLLLAEGVILGLVKAWRGGVPVLADFPGYSPVMLAPDKWRDEGDALVYQEEVWFRCDGDPTEPQYLRGTYMTGPAGLLWTDDEPISVMPVWAGSEVGVRPEFQLP